ncbi:hypothetical protein [Paenibacillus radicis (ex Gao et al. 2016)]|nr:hypothetical protein [Paenibacillus radicis (ex Gao et al. 2016)]
MLILESDDGVLCNLLPLDTRGEVGLQVAFVVEEPKEALERPGVQ